MAAWCVERAALLAMLLGPSVALAAAAGAPVIPKSTQGAPPARAAAPATAAGVAGTVVGPPPATPLFSATPPPPCDKPLCYTATSLQAERNHIVLMHIDIVDTTRGPAHITADRADATGAQLGNSHWVLTGQVHMDMPQGQLRADTAIIQMMDNRIASIVAQGKPAQFQRLAQPGPANATPGRAPAAPASATRTPGAAAGAPGKPPGTPAGASSAGGVNMTDVAVYGHADTITYDVKQGLVRLIGHSWLTDGCNEITSPQIDYQIASQTVQAGPEPGTHGRVHGTIRSTRPGGTSCSGPGAS